MEELFSLDYRDVAIVILALSQILVVFVAIYNKKHFDRRIDLLAGDTKDHVSYLHKRMDGHAPVKHVRKHRDIL